jgi:uncharacterized protein (DUF1697 family)
VAAKSESVRYVAFLRGINVGGHRLVKMVELAAMFEAMGFIDVKTVIASGNVLFTARDADSCRVTVKIERGLAEALGYEVRVMLRTVNYLRMLVDREPFAGIDDESIHRYVVFYPTLPETFPALPMHFPEEAYSFLAIEGTDLFMIAGMTESGERADFGKSLVKHFGKISTSRNWNTIVKIARR